MTATLVANLRKSQAEKSEKRESTFHELARRVAAGEKVPTKEAETVLEVTGRSPEDLESAVTTWRARYEAAPLLGEEQSLQNELPTVYADVDALTAEHAEIAEKLRAARDKASTRYRAIHRRLTEITAARRVMEATCRDPRALAALQSARARLSDLRETISRKRGHLTALLNAIRLHQQQLAQHDASRGNLNGQGIVVHDGARMQLDERIRRLQGEYDDISRKVDGLACEQQDAIAAVAEAESVVYAA